MNKAVEINFSCVFNYAKREFGIEWNACCELFHDSGYFEYPRCHEVDLCFDGDEDTLSKEDILAIDDSYSKAKVIFFKYLETQDIPKGFAVMVDND